MFAYEDKFKFVENEDKREEYENKGESRKSVPQDPGAHASAKNSPRVNGLPTYRNFK